MALALAMAVSGAMAMALAVAMAMAMAMAMALAMAMAMAKALAMAMDMALAMALAMENSKRSIKERERRNIMDSNIQFKIGGEVEGLDLYLEIYPSTELMIMCKGAEVMDIILDGYEFNPDNDLNWSFYFRVGNGYYNLVEIIREANLQLPDLIAQVEEEQEEDRRMDEELSSPYLTGRI